MDAYMLVFAACCSPPERSAIASAGGALGVAALGSPLASGYRADMDSVTSARPGSAAAHDSSGGALAAGAATTTAPGTVTG